jgi:hypothetical protein
MNDEIIKVTLQGFDWIGLFSTIFVLLGIVVALFWTLYREKREREKKAMVIRSCLLRPLNAIESKLGDIMNGKVEVGRAVFEKSNKANFDRIELLLEQSDCLIKKEITMLEHFIDYFKQCDALSSSDSKGVSRLRIEVIELIGELTWKKQYPKKRRAGKKRHPVS